MRRKKKLTPEVSRAEIERKQKEGKKKKVGSNIRNMRWTVLDENSSLKDIEEQLNDYFYYF